MTAALVAFVSGSMALLGAWMTHFYSQRRQRRERLWDLKREAYAELLEAFEEGRHIQRRVNDIKWDSPQGVAAAHAMADEINAERKRFRKAKSRNIFLVSAKARDLLMQFDRDCEAWNELIEGGSPDYAEHHRLIFGAYEDVATALAAAAVEDLGVA